MYSSQHRVAFVHIPKTAGTSLELFFTGYDWIAHSPEDYAAYLAGEPLWDRGLHYFESRARVKHATQAELAAELGAATWNASFRFTIVRNPWTRLLSVYDHIVRAGAAPRSFAAWLSQRDPVDNLGQPVFREWISDWNDFDFIGRFERLDADFARLLRMLGLPRAGLPMERHGSDGRHDRAQYDDKARQIIADHCAAEIERFKYRFEEAFPPAPPTSAASRIRPLLHGIAMVPGVPGEFTVRAPALHQ